MPFGDLLGVGLRAGLISKNEDARAARVTVPHAVPAFPGKGRWDSSDGPRRSALGVVATLPVTIQYKPRFAVARKKIVAAGKRSRAPSGTQLVIAFRVVPNEATLTTAPSKNLDTLSGTTNQA